MSTEEDTLSTMPRKYHDDYLNKPECMSFDDWLADKCDRETMYEAVMAGKAVRILNKWRGVEASRALGCCATFGILEEAYIDACEQAGCPKEEL